MLKLVVRFRGTCWQCWYHCM